MCERERLCPSPLSHFATRASNVLCIHCIKYLIFQSLCSLFSSRSYVNVYSIWPAGLLLFLILFTSAARLYPQQNRMGGRGGANELSPNRVQIKPLLSTFRFTSDALYIESSRVEACGNAHSFGQCSYKREAKVRVNTCSALRVILKCFDVCFVL